MMKQFAIVLILLAFISYLNALDNDETATNEIDNESILHHHHHQHQHHSNDQKCQTKRMGESPSGHHFLNDRILFVGLVSSLVFAFIGILPAFFVKVGEEDFS